MNKLTKIFIVILFLTVPKSLHAHVVDAPAERIMTLLENHRSGLFTLSASQYATETLIELEVHVSAFGGSLPADTTVEIVAISAETNQQYTASLMRHHNAFTTTLPLNGEDWQVTIAVVGNGEVGSAEVTVMPYRPPAETPPLIRNLTFASPFLLLLVAVLFFKRFDIALR